MYFMVYKLLKIKIFNYRIKDKNTKNKLKLKIKGASKILTHLQLLVFSF